MVGGPPTGHVPVLMAEVLEHLAPLQGQRVLDCTLGLGGHSTALLSRGTTVLGVDRDPDARHLAQQALVAHGPRFACRSGTFADAADELAAAGEQFDGILADLGVSSMQLDRDERGFSIRSGARADMRMGEACARDAIELIAGSSQEELAGIIRDYGEEPRAGRAARALQEAVAAGRTSGAELAEALRAVLPGQRGRHPATRCFQALRMAVNEELDQLRRLLDRLPTLLKPGGRAVLIAFHSLEDRLVKRAFRAQLASGLYADTNRKVVQASASEVLANPRAHSAKLRWAVRSTLRPETPCAAP